MATEKFDTALRILVTNQEKRMASSPVEVSIRLERPPDAEQVRQMIESGVATADTQRRVFFARLPVATLATVASLPWVKQISLCRTMEPKPGE